MKEVRYYIQLVVHFLSEVVIFLSLVVKKMARLVKSPGRIQLVLLFSARVVKTVGKSLYFILTKIKS